MIMSIESEIEGPLPIEDLAKLVSLSASYFCRAFEGSFSEPLHAYNRRAKRHRSGRHLHQHVRGVDRRGATGPRPSFRESEACLSDEAPIPPPPRWPSSRIERAR